MDSTCTAAACIAASRSSDCTARQSASRRRWWPRAIACFGTTSQGHWRRRAAEPAYTRRLTQQTAMLSSSTTGVSQPA